MQATQLSDGLHVKVKKLCIETQENESYLECQAEIQQKVQNKNQCHVTEEVKLTYNSGPKGKKSKSKTNNYNPWCKFNKS